MTSYGWTKPIPLEEQYTPQESEHRVRELTKDNIDEFHASLAASYHCSIDDIDYDFERILDTNDEDHRDAIRIVFYLKTREIFNLKMAIPEELKQMAIHLKSGGPTSQF
jgi:hypothetical protein